MTAHLACGLGFPSTRASRARHPRTLARPKISNVERPIETCAKLTSSTHTDDPPPRHTPPSPPQAKMASTLALQLQKIAAASTNTLNTKKLKTLHSASLLFDRAHAATQGLDTIYSIALDGFHELCAIDGRFAVFEKGLFSEASKERMTRCGEEAGGGQDLEIRVCAVCEKAFGGLRWARK